MNPPSSTTYLIVHSIRRVPIRGPADQAGTALVADQGQGPLVGTEAVVLIGVSGAICSPDAQSAGASWLEGAVACAADTCVYLYALDDYRGKSK